MMDMDEYMRCLEEIAFTNHIEDASEEECLILPDPSEASSPFKRIKLDDDEESKHPENQENMGDQPLSS